MNVENKVIVITGGGGTLGSAMAKGLASAGARLVLTGRTEAKLVEAQKAIKDAGGEAIVKTSNVLEKESQEQLCTYVLEKYGTVDVLINGAGGNQSGATIQPHQSFFDMPLDALNKVTDLNFQGTVIPTMVFGKLMSESKKGSVINISSMASQQAITRIAGYSASKAAVDNFTRWLAVEMANKYGDGIRVNAIAPGFFIAEQNRKLLTNEDGSYTNRAHTIITNTPMKRFGRPEELIGVVQWLASDAASFVTGTIIPIDGGFSAFSGV